MFPLARAVFTMNAYNCFRSSITVRNDGFILNIFYMIYEKMRSGLHSIITAKMYSNTVTGPRRYVSEDEA